VVAIVIIANIIVANAIVANVIIANTIATNVIVTIICNASNCTVCILLHNVMNLSVVQRIYKPNSALQGNLGENQCNCGLSFSSNVIALCALSRLAIY